MARAKGTYTAKDIQVLEGLEPVRKRPAMYIGGTGKPGYHHLLWEVVDNSIDEVINKQATRVDVTLHKDGKTCTVEDNGRGIPVGNIKKFRKPALEIILTTLHAGGKFDRSKVYSHSGGLHGVGASVVNALSSKMTAIVKRKAAKYQQSFVRGKPTAKMKKAGSAKGSGTRITFTPDEQIFGPELCFDAKIIAETLESKSYLHRGIKIVFRDETAKPARSVVYQHENGITEFLSKIVDERGKGTVPTDAEGCFIEKAGEVKIELAFQWTEATDEHITTWPPTSWRPKA